MMRATKTPFVKRPIGGVALALVLSLAALVAPTGATDVVGATAEDELTLGSAELTGAASAYLPVNPVRILDTRSNSGIKRVFENSSFSIDPVTGTSVAEAAGVEPGDITAVIVNTTMVRAGGVGFGTVWPTGGQRLSTSTNNTEFDGHTIPNLVIAPLGLDNKISVYASTEADVILDVLGVFVSSDATSAGRFESLGPTRAYDTREGDPEIDPGGTQIIDLTEAGVPVDASGVVLNVTAVRSQGRGFYRVWSADAPEPEHSNMNVLDVNYQAGNQVITGVSDGQIQVFSDVGGGLTVDVTGYFTGSDADSSTEGLFVPFTPGRLLDTRVSSETTGTTGDKLTADDEFALEVAGRLDVPETGAKAIALNITAVRADARGFIKAYPDGTVEPPSSSINFTDADQIVANHAITSISETSGAITIQPSQQTHVVVDANGYFLAADAPLPTGEAAVDKTVVPTDVVPDPLPETSPTSGPYDFLYDRNTFFSQGVRPDPTIKAAWDNCFPLRYALNVDLAENDAQIQQLIDSIDEMEAATGIDFQFAGVTSAGMNVADRLVIPELTDDPFMYLPPDDNGTGPVDLVIGFSNEADTLDLRGGVIGTGGSIFSEDQDGNLEQLRGFAVIDLTNLYVGDADSELTLRNIKATTTHEIGHLMGLGHVDLTAAGGGLNPGFSAAVIAEQLMFPVFNRFDPEPDGTFNDGDQQGLFELYANRPCSASGSLGGNDDEQGAVDDGIDWSNVTIVKSVDDF